MAPDYVFGDIHESVVESFVRMYGIDIVMFVSGTQVVSDLLRTVGCHVIATYVSRSCDLTAKRTACEIDNLDLSSCKQYLCFLVSNTSTLES